jgi:NADH-quinone oxidoreductase subunit L
MLERKVLLAASTMSSIGLMFAAAAASFWVDIEIEHMNFAVLVAFWYMAVHAFAKASLFLVSGHLIHATHSRFLSGGLEFGKKMRPAFIVTIIATTFLVGIPPLTSYWVKSAMDEVMEHLFHEVGYLPLILLVLTSVVYSGIMAKFLALNFIKGEKPHHEHTEGGRLMILGYSLMVSVLFLLIYLIFTSHETHEFVAAGAVFKEGTITISFAVGILALIAYLVALYKPQIGSLSGLGTFFGDRMYLPFLNDFIIPKIGFFVSRIVQDYGNRGIDGFFNTRIIPGIFGLISGSIRSIQTGYLNRYVNVVLGLVMLLLIVVTIGGVWL